MSEPHSETVTIEQTGAIALIPLDNPPVNAASHAVRSGIMAALDNLQADNTVKAIAIYGKGRTFIAGADIREFGKPPMPPSLPEICNAIEACSKPVVAVIHGTALGGGFEVAMAAHARIAVKGSHVGLPEVTLGILPGAGGTQRAPRLAGMAAALDLITTGRRISVKEAKTLGLVDDIRAETPRDIALAAAEEVIAGTLQTRRTGDLAVTEDTGALDAARAALAARQPHLFSPQNCVEAVAASVLPIEDGLKRERALFKECLDHPQRAALVHAFFSERAVAKIPEAGATPREVNRLGVIGGGTMGSGIATAALLSGLEVILAERDEDGLARGAATIGKNLAGAVKRGKLSEEKRATILSDKLTATTDLGRFAEVDLVIEAVFEDMDVKKDIFRQLDKVCRKGAVLATNTSYLDVNEIAAVTSRPEDVIGLHFFSPAHVMRLLEVVVAEKTAPDAVATGFALGRRLGKVCVRAGVCDGFIGNRILSHYKKVAEYVVMDGATPAQVDAAMTGFGFAMGPFAVSDLAGLDIGWATRKRLAPARPPEERYIPIADRICERGWYGRKTGKGFYDYGGDSLEPAPELEQIIADERAKAGVTARTFTDQEIVDRFMTAMVSEAARVLEDGIALRPIDIDATYLFGYGFPRFHGGPMHYADTVGAAELVRRIETYAHDDPYYWQVPPLLARMAAEGTQFAYMNREA